MKSEQLGIEGECLPTDPMSICERIARLCRCPSNDRDAVFQLVKGLPGFTIDEKQKFWMRYALLYHNAANHAQARARRERADVTLAVVSAPYPGDPPTMMVRTAADHETAPLPAWREYVPIEVFKMEATDDPGRDS